MKKTLSAILAGFIAVAGLYAQTASFDEGYWITPAPVLSATPFPSLFLPNDAAFGAVARPMQAETDAEGQLSMFSVGLNFTFLSSFRDLGSVITSGTDYQGRTWTSENRLAHWSIFGIGAFFDARYVELSVGISIVSQFWRDWGGDGEGIAFPVLDFNLLFKLPLQLPSGLPLEGYVFPLLGAGYNIVRFPFNRNIRDASHFNTVRILFGVGLDLPIGNNTFFRTSVLGHYTFAPRIVRDRAANSISDASHSGGWGISLLFGIGFGL
ncbi:MAG: hypothetical protein FWC64_02265 [Treponema sp.]|nr:hypothetical protein [Treponema sp.]